MKVKIYTVHKQDWSFLLALLNGMW